MTDLDSKIAEKRKLISKLEREVAQLETEKAKQNDNYIGRAFKMKGLEYIYVTEEWDGILYGILFQEFECTNSVDIYRNCRFNPDNIEKEIGVDLFKKKLEGAIGHGVLKKLLII